jgi:hypothetical protein
LLKNASSKNLNPLRQFFSAKICAIKFAFRIEKFGGQPITKLALKNAGR